MPSAEAPRMRSPSVSVGGIELACGTLDGAFDARVGAAAAHLVAQRLADLGGRGVGGAVEEGDAGHDEAGNTVAALQGRLVHERLLDGVELVAAGDPFDGGEVPAGDAADRGDAGADGLAID